MEAYRSADDFYERYAPDMQNVIEQVERIIYPSPRSESRGNYSDTIGSNEATWTHQELLDRLYDSEEFKIVKGQREQHPARFIIGNATAALSEYVQQRLDNTGIHLEESTIDLVTAPAAVILNQRHCLSVDAAYSISETTLKNTIPEGKPDLWPRFRVCNYAEAKYYRIEEFDPANGPLIARTCLLTLDGKTVRAEASSSSGAYPGFMDIYHGGLTADTLPDITTIMRLSVALEDLH